MDECRRRKSAPHGETEQPLWTIQLFQFLFFPSVDLPLCYSVCVKDDREMKTAKVDANGLCLTMAINGLAMPRIFATRRRLMCLSAVRDRDPLEAGVLHAQAERRPACAEVCRLVDVVATEDVDISGLGIEREFPDVGFGVRGR